MLRKIFQNSIIYTIGPQIPRLAGILVLPLITPYLTSIDYGIYGLITAYLGTLGALADLGMAVVMVNSFYKYPAKWPVIWKQIHGYLAIWSLVFGAILAVLLYFIIPHEAAKNKGLIILLNIIPVAFFNTTVIFGSRYYQFSGKPLFISVSTAIIGSASIIANYVTIAVFKLGYMGWFISSFLSSFLLFLAFIYPVFIKYKLSPIFAFRKRFLIRHLKVALPLIPHDYSAYLINSSDRIVFSITGVKLSNQGKYNLAYTFGNYFEFFGTALGMAISPFYTKINSRGGAKSDMDLRNMTFFFQVLFLVIGSLVGLWCKEILKVLIKNTSLQDAYSLAIIIVMGYMYRPMYWACYARLSFNEKTGQLWKISFTAGVINVILNLIFVPLYGIYAAAVTTFLALLYLGFSGFFLQAYKETRPPDYYPVFWLILIIVVSAAVFLMKDWSVSYKILVTLIIMIAVSSAGLKFRKQIKMLGR